MKKSFLIEWPDELGLDWLGWGRLQKFLHDRWPMVTVNVVELTYSGKERRGSMSGKSPKHRIKDMRYVLIKDVVIPAGTVFYKVINDPLERDNPPRLSHYKANLSMGELVVCENEIQEFDQPLVKLREGSHDEQG